MNSKQEDKHKATEQDVVYALDSEIKVWREEARLAIENCYTNNRTAFSELPPQFAAGASFNFFKGFVENFYPASLGAIALKRAAAPIWLTTEAVKLYKEYYKKEAKAANKLLQNNYLAFKDTFVQNIQNAERQFLNSTFGRDMASQIVKIVSRRRFRDYVDSRTHIRDTVSKSKVINTDSKEHRKRINDSLGKLLRRVKDIFTGSVYGPGKTGLYLVRWKDAACGTEAERWYSQHPWVRGPGIDVEDIDPNMLKSKYAPEINRLTARFNGKAECVIPIETINHGNIGSTTGGKETMKIIANINKYDVICDPATVPIFGRSETYAWINEQPNTSIYSLSGSLLGKLSPEAITALRQAEEDVWNARNGF